MSYDMYQVHFYEGVGPEHDITKVAAEHQKRVKRLERGGGDSGDIGVGFDPYGLIPEKPAFKKKREAALKQLRQADVVVTSYETVRSWIVVTLVCCLKLDRCDSCCLRFGHVLTVV